MRFEIFEIQSRFGPPSTWEYEWRWRLRARSGRIMATGNEGYKSKAKVRRAIIRLWTSLQFKKPPVVEVEA